MSPNSTSSQPSSLVFILRNPQLSHFYNLAHQLPGQVIVASHLNRARPVTPDEKEPHVIEDDKDRT